MEFEALAMRTNDEIKAIVEGTFRPLCCFAEIWHYQEKLRFQVSDSNGQAVLTHKQVILDHVREDGGLVSLIEEMRARIEEKGYSLDKWELPPEAEPQGQPSPPISMRIYAAFAAYSLAGMASQPPKNNRISRASP